MKQYGAELNLNHRVDCQCCVPRKTGNGIKVTHTSPTKKRVERAAKRKARQENKKKVREEQ